MVWCMICVPVITLIDSVSNAKSIRSVIKCKENKSVNTLDNIYVEIYYLKIIELFFWQRQCYNMSLWYYYM